MIRPLTLHITPGQPTYTRSTTWGVYNSGCHSTLAHELGNHINNNNRFQSGTHYGPRPLLHGTQKIEKNGVMVFHGTELLD